MRRGRLLQEKDVVIGEMDERITIQAFTTSKDAYGEDTKTWYDWKTVWAKVAEPSGKESMTADKETAFTRLVVYIRHLADIGKDYRVVIDGNNYDILTVLKVGRRRYKKLLLKLVE